jgi:hypothetical protein
MKIFFVNIILPLIMLFIGFVFLIPIAYTLSFTIDSSTIKEKIAYGFGFLLSTGLAWFILSTIFQYWMIHNSNSTYGLKGIIIGFIALIAIFKIVQYILPILFPDKFSRF